MPLYSYSCPKKHRTERAFPLARMKKFIVCGCGRRAQLGMALLAGQFVRNAAMNEATRRQFRHTFGKKKFGRLRTTGDVDACFADFQRRYPHLQPPGAMRRDPFPETNITESRDTHGE